MTTKQTKLVGITLAVVLLALVVATAIVPTAYAQPQYNTGNNAKHFDGGSNQFGTTNQANTNTGSNVAG